MKYVVAMIVAVTAVTLVATDANALINPNFTPLHLTKDSMLILRVKPVRIGGKGPVVLDIVKVLKGETGEKQISIDIAGVEPAQVKALLKALAGRTVASFYVGKYRAAAAAPGGGEDGGMDGMDGGGEDEGEPEPAGVLRGMLHVGRPWYSINRTGKGGWKLEAQDNKMLGTWDGAPEMLLRAVNYILKNDGATMPSEASVASFAELAEPPKLNGAATAVQAVDVAGDGELALFIVSKAGDQLLRWDADKKAFIDATAKAGLTSKSVAAAWADVSGDGRLDLASWDGAKVVCHIAVDGGKFAARSIEVEGKLPAEVGAITSLASSFAGQAALVLSSPTGATLLTPKGDGQYIATPLPIPAAAAKFGKAGAALTADFDGDARCDVLVPFEKGGLLYLGTPRAGVFATPKPVAVSFGKLPGGAVVGDWDADGLLDVFIAAAGGCRMYQNHGKGVFVESIEFCGETYKTQPGGIAAGVCEINNDGREDLLVFYGNAQSEESAMPQLYFNRGFRAFGYDVDANTNVMKQALPDTAKGQKAGLMADLNGDGGPDLVVVLASGEVQILMGDDNEDALGLIVSMPAKAKRAGPITVTARIDSRSLGSRSIRPGDGGAYFAIEDPEGITFTYRFPGGKVQKKDPGVIEDGRVRRELKSK